MSSRAIVGTVTASVALATLAGCGSPSPTTTTSQSPSTSPTTTISTPSSPTVSPSPSASATATESPTASGIGLCTSNIRVIPGESQGAAGHLVLVLIFNNVGHTPCRMYGYPGLDLVTPSGALVVHARRTLSGMAGGATSVASVTLAPGASASALVEASDVPQGTITNCGSYSLMVTPPEEYVAVPAGTAMMPRCDLQIHPVVAGNHGGLH